MTFDQIRQIAYETKFWTKLEHETLVNNSYLPEFVQACHEHLTKEESSHDENNSSAKF